MIKTFILALIICVTAHAAHAQAQRESQPGVFDYYLFNLSWHPEFCHNPRHADDEECKNGAHGFVVHGLWPQFTQGYPEYCAHKPAGAAAEHALDVMPSLRLAYHEWAAHGTCSGVDPDQYFDKIRKAYAAIKIPPMFQNPERSFSIEPQKIKQAFVDANAGLRAEDMAISCGHNYLTAVEICLGKDNLNPHTCGAVRDCHAKIIRVASVRE